MLEIALRSALRQREVHIEVIVVDDASSDDSQEVVSAFDEPRLRLLRNPVPTGPGEARNEVRARRAGNGSRSSTTTIRGRPPGSRARSARRPTLGRSGVYAGSVNVDDDLRIIHGRPPPDAEVVMATLRRSNAIPGGGANVIVRRWAFAEVGGFDECFSPCEDWELWSG
jgi:glycosyltransferase involved in cell wall biosynthesis